MREFKQPPPPPDGSVRHSKLSAADMSDRAAQLAERVREMYWYSTSHAPRQTQVQLGPSELGDPCDGKLMRRLLGLTPSNHGRSDGWAATVGTAGHAWLAEALSDYDGGRGRFLLEYPIRIPSSLGDQYDVVGTLDWYDRRTRQVIDHKFLGEYTLDKLTASGEPETRYQIQLQIYAHGLSIAGEEPKEVAIIGWPRTEATLNKLYVWVADYDPEVARAALDRRDALLSAALERGESYPATLLRDTPIAPSALCSYCPFYRPYAVDVMDGCRGVADLP